MPSSRHKRTKILSTTRHGDPSPQTLKELESVLRFLDQELPREMHTHPNRWILAVCCDKLGTIFDTIGFFTKKATTQAAPWIEGTKELYEALRIVSTDNAKPPALKRDTFDRARDMLRNSFTSETFAAYVNFWVNFARAEGEQWHTHVAQLFRVCRVVCPWALKEAESTVNTTLGRIFDTGRPDTSSSRSSFGCQDGMTIPSSYISGNKGTDPSCAEAPITISDATVGMPYNEMASSALPVRIHRYER